MRLRTISLAAFVVLAATAPLPARSQTSTAAVVNGAPLQRWEVERELSGLISAGSYHRNVAAERRAELEQEALDRLILKELESQWLRQRRLPYDSESAADAWRAVRQRFDSEEAYQAALRSKGIDDAGFRRAFERDAAATAAEAEVVSRVAEPTALEIEVYFLLHGDDYQRPESRHVVHALVYVPASASREQWDRAEERAEELVRGARASRTSLLAASRGLQEQVPPRLRDQIGDLGFVHRGSLQPALDDAVFGISPGEISDPVRSIYGYHVIQVLEVNPPKALELVEVREAVVDRMVREARSQALAEFASSLRESARIEVSAWPESP